MNLVVFFFMMITIFAFISPVHATTFSLSTGSVQAVDSEFGVDVIVDSVTDLFGMAAHLIYDPEYLDVVDSDGMPGNGIQPKVTEGGFLNNNGADPTILRAELKDETAGTLVIGITRRGAVTGVNTSSNKIVLSPRFKAKKVGTNISIGFTRSGLRNSSKGAIPVTAWNGVTFAISEVTSLLSLNCPSTDFGTVNIGGSSSLSCTASNVGDRELVITSIDIAGANFTRAHDCSNVAPGNSCGITVTFTPTAAGPKAAKLTITSSDPYSPRDVPFNGTGVSTLTVAVHPPGGGTVTGTNINCPGDCVETYSTSGATVQLTATPLGAYQFVNWTGTASGVSNPITLNMDVNQSITANFEASTYVLTVNKAGPGKGTVTSLDGKISCGESCSSQSAEYNAGDSVTLSANAGSGSAFSSWSGGGCTGVGTCLLTMNADVTVTASFDVVIAPKMLVSSIILSEDFSTGIPTSWPVGGDFTTGGPGIPCPATPAIAAPFAAPWAIVDSSCFETLYEELYTPIFDASSCSNVSLLFSNQYYDDPSSSVHVAITDNDGLPWTNALAMDTNDGYPVPNTKEIDISLVAGSEEAQIRFAYSGEGNFWAIDNIQVICQEPDEVRFVSPLGRIASRTVVITSTGTSDLHIGNLSISGPHPGDFTISSDGCSTHTIAPSDKCSTEIVFNPLDNGSRNAILSIPSDDPDAPLDLPLQGIGLLFAVSPAKGTIGTVLEIAGSGFGPTKGKVTISNEAGTMAAKVSEWTDGLIRASLSKNLLAGTAYDVTVAPKVPKGTPPITEPDAFEFRAPEIVWLSDDHGRAGDVITIRGRDFGTKKGKVYIGTKSCKVVSWTMNPTTGYGEIVFVVPKGLALGPYDLKVVNKVGTGAAEFTIE